MDKKTKNLHSLWGLEFVLYRIVLYTKHMYFWKYDRIMIRRSYSMVLCIPHGKKILHRIPSLRQPFFPDNLECLFLPRCRFSLIEYIRCSSISFLYRPTATLVIKVLFRCKIQNSKTITSNVSGTCMEY